MTTEKQLRADILKAAASGNGRGGVRRVDIRRVLGHVDERHFRERFGGWSTRVGWFAGLAAGMRP